MTYSTPISKTGTQPGYKKSNAFFFQPKLSVNQPGDRDEQEADAMADKVMRMPDVVSKNNTFFSSAVTAVQRECSHCDKAEESQVQRKENSTKPSSSAGTENYIQSISGGSPLHEKDKSFFGSRMGYDFSNVRLHTDSAAASAAKSVNALAYTTGNNIVFNNGQYDTNTDSGKRLLAHELTHVVQQSNMTGNNIQRYSDPDHHILEEVALSGIFSDAELKNIERGNMGRDYSQMPSIGSGLTVGEPDLGGYKEHEHFDHFIFDRDKNRWVSHSEYEKIWDEYSKEWVDRPVPLRPRATPKTTPLDYIENELMKAIEKDMPDSSSFIHVGNAFHTIEDFFAHSNFIELTKGDYSSGKELTTHPPGARGPDSTDSILSNVLDPVPASVYKEKFERGYETASAVSHGRMAKDFHINPNHSLAITLAALVIRQVGLMVKTAFALQTKQQRNAYVKDMIMATLTSYLRPPDEKNKWWEKLLAEDNGRTARQIKDLQDKTPVTVNQVPTSPLRNLEATRFSSWKAIGLGTSVSIQLKDRTFFTAGWMLYAPGTGNSLDDKMFVAPRAAWAADDKPAFVYGAQVTGTFDLTDMLSKKK